MREEQLSLRLCLMCALLRHPPSLTPAPAPAPAPASLTPAWLFVIPALFLSMRGLMGSPAARSRSP